MDTIDCNKLHRLVQFITVEAASDDVIKKRKKRDTSQKRQAILDGALQVFTQYGYGAASMDGIAEISGVSKRTIYNHFQSKEILFREMIADFLLQRDQIKPAGYSTTAPLKDQLIAFAKAELFLVLDPVQRNFSKLLTATFLMDLKLGKEIRSQFQPHSAFITWLIAAKNDSMLSFESPELPARIFYGMVEGCLTWGALFTDGENLKNADRLLDEICMVYLSRYKR